MKRTEAAVVPSVVAKRSRPRSPKRAAVLARMAPRTVASIRAGAKSVIPLFFQQCSKNNGRAWLTAGAFGGEATAGAAFGGARLFIRPLRLLSFYCFTTRINPKRPTTPSLTGLKKYII